MILKGGAVTEQQRMKLSVRSRVDLESKLLEELSGQGKLEEGVEAVTVRAWDADLDRFVPVLGEYTDTPASLGASPPLPHRQPK
eukprot:SAG11_NODE_3365_length_2495_cov_1.544658_3_plen_84_part_00